MPPLFHLAQTRARHIARQLLTDLGDDKVAVSDRYNAYDWIAHPNHQTCWAHLLRHFRRFELRGGESQTTGGNLLIYGEYLLHRWRRLKRGEITRRQFQKELPKHRENDFQVASLRCSIVTIDEPVSPVSGFWRSLRPYSCLLAFPMLIPPTMFCERTLRHAVIWRKLSLGNDSDAGHYLCRTHPQCAGNLSATESQSLQLPATACPC